MNILPKKLLLSCFVATLVTACSTVGLGQVPQTRDSYNRALDASENEQFLLSVVRMHYAEAPYFVSVDSLTATTTLTTAVRGNIGVANAFNVGNGAFWNLSPYAEFSQSPTITYSPNQGAKFAIGMLAPLTMGKLFLLTQSGYSFSETIKLAINRIGILQNGGVDTDHIGAKTLPDTSAFDGFINLLNQSSRAGQASFDYLPYESRGAIYVKMKTPDGAAKAAKYLGLSKPYQTLVFVQDLPDPDNHLPENVITVYARSYFNIINYLARDVDTPKNESKYESVGYSATLVDSSIDWTPYSNHLLHVLTSTSEPAKAVAKTEYNNNWYYIADNDQASKATMVILKLIYSLQMGEVDANLPVITIPVK